MFRIEGTARDYPWGSREAIPSLLGRPPAPHPVAELWFGAHPHGPSRVLDAAAGDLRRLIGADPQGTLGADVVTRFGSQLPYLLKIVAPAAPLSLQVHPGRARAQERYAYEDAVGIPIGAPHRNYKDRNHKPELLYALTDFEALAGFRAPRRAAELFHGLEVPLAQRLSRILRADATAAGVRSAFTHLLSPRSRPTAAEVEDVARACAERARDGSPSPRADRIAVMLNEHHPGDPGVVASLLLNPVGLRPGDALFVPVGGVHAYLSGLGVEVMASSDNVLRGCLTRKHVDVAELLDCVDYVAAPPIRIAPERFHDATRVYYAPVDDFELSVTELSDDERREAHPLPGRGPRTVVCLAGWAELRSDRGCVRLERGEAVFVSAEERRVTIRGAGTVVQADVP